MLVLTKHCFLTKINHDITKEDKIIICLALRNLGFIDMITQRKVKKSSFQINPLVMFCLVLEFQGQHLYADTIKMLEEN